MTRKTADMAPLKAGIVRLRHKHRHSLRSGKGEYRVDTDAAPINRSVEISGPGREIRWLRDGSHDFSSFSELAKTIVRPGMTDLEKAMAVYRFSNHYATHGGMGWGRTEMTRFLNCFGYSFCFGQADFQHLLYEAVGLQARQPGLKGHASVEVLIDGHWRMLDAYVQLALPSPELGGLATGQELTENPWIFEAALSVPKCVDTFKKYWSGFVAANAAEPWQDSRAMALTMRRRETLRFDYGRREVYCLAPGTPANFVNGEWAWRPKFDDKHLATEVGATANVVAINGRLRAEDASQEASIDYRLHSPYPLCKGSLRLKCAGAGSVRLSLSTDERKTWTTLHDGGGTVEVQLDDHLSPATLDNIGEAHSEALIGASVFDLIVRLEFSGEITVRALDLSCVVQANPPSLPALQQGVNQWQLISNNADSAITHCWDEFPEFSISNPTPYEGEEVTLSLTVHNRTAKKLRRVPVRFSLSGTDVEIAKVVIPEIKARGSMTVSTAWAAEMVPDRTHGYTPAEISLYVHSLIEAHVGEETEEGKYTGVAQVQATVRPLPLPRVEDRLLWSSETRFQHENKVVLRAVMFNELGRYTDPRLTYLPDSPLTATLTPYLGHPDRDGRQLAEGVRCCDVQPTEFAMAEWTLNTVSLPSTFDLYVETRSELPVAPEKQRMLAHKRVRVRPAKAAVKA